MELKRYACVITAELNEFLDGQNIFVNGTVYPGTGVIKLSHEKEKKEIFISDETPKVITCKSEKIYSGDDIYIIPPNWSEAAAKEDARELIIEILNDL